MAHRPPQTNVKLKKIKKYLDERKMSYADLGRSINYSRDYISRLMREKRPINENLVLHLLDLAIKIEKFK